MLFNTLTLWGLCFQMNNNMSNIKLTTVIKAKHIDEKGQLKQDSYFWILPEDLSAKKGDLAFVETSQGAQIVQVIDVREWGEKKIEKFIYKVSKYRHKEPNE